MTNGDSGGSIVPGYTAPGDANFQSSKNRSEFAHGQILFVVPSGTSSLLAQYLHLEWRQSKIESIRKFETTFSFTHSGLSCFGIGIVSNISIETKDSADAGNHREFSLSSYHEVLPESFHKVLVNELSLAKFSRAL